MKARLIPLIVALVAGLTLVAPSASAPPAGYSVQIEREATLVSPLTLAVSVVVQCPAGKGGVTVRVVVSQPQTVGPNTEGTAPPMSITCTGAKQMLSMTVVRMSGGATFSVGSAFAQADVVVGFLVAQDFRVITIS